MNADPQLRERLDRAAADLRIDPEPRLDDIHRSAPRRERNRRVAALVVAAAVGLAAVNVVWQLRSTGDRSHRPAADVTPTGRIAYMSLTKPLSKKDASDLFVLDAASGEVAPLVEGEGFSIFPQWSPDGSSVAYASDESGGTLGEFIDIFVAEADGTDAVSLLGPGRMLDDPGPIALSWSPDGSRIVYAGRDLETGRQGIWIVNADGSGHRRVLDGYWEAVSWSPDGRRLVLTGDPQTKGNSRQIDLYTIGVDGTGLVRLTDDGSIERWPSWSPDGTRIMFADVRVAFENPDYGQDIYVMDTDGSDRRRLTDWEGLDSFAVWSPDGSWIAFASDRDATPEQQEGNRSNQPFAGVSIYAMRPDGSDVVRLLDGGEVAFLPGSWTS
jgi:Tol biopolymer transport system component